MQTDPEAGDSLDSLHEKLKVVTFAYHATVPSLTFSLRLHYIKSQFYQLLSLVSVLVGRVPAIKRLKSNIKHSLNEKRKQSEYATL